MGFIDTAGWANVLSASDHGQGIWQFGPGRQSQLERAAPRRPSGSQPWTWQCAVAPGPRRSVGVRGLVECAGSAIDLGRRRRCCGPTILGAGAGLRVQCRLRGPSTPVWPRRWEESSPLAWELLSITWRLPWESFASPGQAVAGHPDDEVGYWPIRRSSPRASPRIRTRKPLLRR